MPARARLVAALSALAVLVAPVRSALAWVDVHVEADDVRVVLERTGESRVEHKITLKIAGGPLRSFDLRGVDADAAPDPEGYVVPQREAARSSLASAVGAVAERLPLDAKPRPDGSPAPTVLRVRFDRDKGLGRGIYVLFVRYVTHLVARLPPRGPGAEPLTHVEWKSPVWDDGFDSARVTFDLPAAPTEPRADDAAADPAAGEVAPRAPIFLSTVRRGTARDQIELLRPYAPKGEAVTWAIRADARALQPPALAPPRPGGVRAAITEALDHSANRALLAAGALALFVFYSVLVALKAAEVARCARAAGSEPSPLVPLPAAARAVLAGAGLVGGLFVQLFLARATLGALLVLAAVVLAAHRTPRWRRAALRGPGRWLPVAEATALAEPPRPSGAYLDVSTRAGKALLLALLGAVFGLVFWMYDTWPHRAELVAFDAATLLAVFCTGRLAELPPDPATAPARLLRAVAKRLRRAFPAGDVRFVGRIRMPEGCADADELRLAVAPRTTPAGFGAIEIGVVYLQGAGGAIALPEVILRVTSGSACEAAIEGLARHGRSARGRRPNERAIVFSPRLPTARMTAGLVAGLVRALSTARTVRTEKVRPRAAPRAA
jgi:hypothetical protein